MYIYAGAEEIRLKRNKAAAAAVSSHSSSTVGHSSASADTGLSLGEAASIWPSGGRASSASAYDGSASSSARLPGGGPSSLEQQVDEALRYQFRRNPRTPQHPPIHALCCLHSLANCGTSKREAKTYATLYARSPTEIEAVARVQLHERMIIKENDY